MNDETTSFGPTPLLFRHLEPEKLSGMLAETLPRGSTYTTIMELGPQSHNMDGLLGPNSIMVLYMEPLGYTRQMVECFLHKERFHIPFTTPHPTLKPYLFTP